MKLSPGFPKEVIDVNEPQGKTGVSSSVLLKMTMLLNVTNKMGSSPSFSVACHFWVNNGKAIGSDYQNGML